ncbi:MAG: sulfatase-like hydrolase/transferase, partial [Acidimicrobiia bacterium]
MAPAPVAAVPPAPSATESASQPNFVLIVTDDQKWDTIGRCSPELDPYDFHAGADACMPNVQSLLQSAGITFLHGNVTQSLCCPSRASILTGQYSTTHGVTYNNGSLLDDSSTIATWLQAAGYRNALMGKYLNGYGYGPFSGYIPPGWDTWEVYHDFHNSDDPYTDYPWISWQAGDEEPLITRFNNADSTSGEACAVGNYYSTDYVCRLALDFLQEDTQTPFFLDLNPASPHLPINVEDRHVGAFQGINIPHYPSTNVLPSPNTPSHLPTTDLPDRVLDRIERTMTNSIEMTLSVDDMVGALHDQLASDGRLDNTVWIFISDNGMANGEQHWRNKGCEYYTCHQVPYVVVCPPNVCPGATPGSVNSDDYVLNIDIAPTLADLAGATPTIGVEGMSLVPLLNDPQTTWRDEWFIHGNDPFYDGIVGIGTDGDWYKYVDLTEAGEFEMYNLNDDPWEIVNLWDNGDYAAVQADLAARLAAHLGAPPPNVPPTAHFSASCTDLDCTFTDGSSDSDGSVVGWDWDFGDGGTSSVQSPSHSFAGGGTYSVSLTV